MKWESVLLLGSSDVILAARTWHQSAFRLEWMALGRGGDMSWDEALQAVSQARRGYYEAAKADLGISIGGAPEAYEWQLAKIAEMAAATAEAASPGTASATGLRARRPSVQAVRRKIISRASLGRARRKCGRGRYCVDRAAIAGFMGSGWRSPAEHRGAQCGSGLRLLAEREG